ncbi:MAG: methyltransferase domain-containing protein, partial [Candidatus Aminicenantes bacterium]|nr:methyltransferase domain-containing protein [Candidatus Aminicenantes bacterium]
MNRTLAPGALDKFPGEATYDIEFTNGTETRLYRLDKGTPHSFRLDNQGLLELYQGAHGREDVPDLAPFVPTPMLVVEKMLEMAGLEATDVVFDLGCGDGRIVITAARKYGARGVGVDIVPERIRDSRAGAEEAGVAGLVEFRQGDAMAVDISPASVVTLYLLPESNLLLRPKLEAQLKPGARVVSHNYSIEG